MKPRIAVIGAGAVGGYVGAGMAAAGHDVTLIDPWPEHVEAIRAGGMRLSGMTPEETRTVRVPTLHLTELQRVARERPIDLAFVSVKSYDTEWAAAMIAPYLSPGGVVLSMQNCINEERIASRLGWGRVLGVVVTGGLGLDLYEPAHIRRTMAKRPGQTCLYVGEPSGRVTARAQAIAAILGDVDEAHATDDLWGERWTKLCVNGMRNGVSAATGMGGNARDTHDGVRRVCIRLGAESVRVGRALGFRVGRIGALDPDTLDRADSGDAAAMAEIERAMLRASEGSARSDLQRPSMAQDMAKGRRTEIDFMNGFIAAKGQEAGVAAPTHARLTEVVRRVERGELRPDPSNVLWN
ncbi:MAG: 2-dehydropantoate 2-reductase [Rhodospirillales bacterium]|nr:2-dehydropantoate 2-reductase [Rhodospirillales bacterium]